MPTRDPSPTGKVIQLPVEATARRAHPLLRQMHAGEVNLLRLRTLLQQQVFASFSWRGDVLGDPKTLMKRVANVVGRHVTSTSLVCSLDKPHTTLYVHVQDETGTYHYGMPLRREWFQ